MIEDFKNDTGRYPECFNFAEAYDDDNLKEGIAYAKWLIEEGFIHEPFYEYNLKKFIKWAKIKLNGRSKKMV